MTELRRFDLRDFLLLLLVVAVAAAARVGYLIRYADNARTAGPCVVEAPSPRLADLPAGADKERPTELGSLVQNLREYSWFGSLAPFAPAEEQTAHVAPGYPWLLALLAHVADDWEKAARWSQAALGALTAGVYFLFARRAFRSVAAGTLAGLLTALHPFWVIDTTSLNDGTLTAFLLGAALWLGATAIQTGGAFASLLFGLTLAGAALVRAALLPFGFAALVWFLLRSRTEARGWLCALLAFLGFANGLAPWTVRNYQVFGEPVPVVDSAQLHLWYGNNPAATGGAATEAMTRSLAAEKAEEMAKVPAAEQPRRYNKLGGAVLDEARGDPLKTLRRRVNALGYFLFSERYFASGRLADATAGESVSADLDVLLLGVLLGTFVLAFLGWRWSYAWRKESMPASLAVLWLPLPYLLGHAEALHGPRLPLDGVLLTYAAFALLCLVPGLGGRLREGEAPPADGDMAEPMPDASATESGVMGTAHPQPAHHQPPQQQRPRTWR